jgi:hypothetical protein
MKAPGNFSETMTQQKETNSTIILTPTCVPDWVDYARHCMSDSIYKYGEIPILTHLLYSQIFDENQNDGKEERLFLERKLIVFVNFLVVYIDKGISSDMEETLTFAQMLDLPIISRRLYNA